MISTIIHGCNGHMGQVLKALIAEDESINIVAGIDVADNTDNPFPVFTSIEACDVEADILIDFSTAKAMDALIDYCSDKKLPAIICTTGLSDEQESRIKELSKSVAVLRSANMSLGINTLIDVVKKVAPVFAQAGFDIEIVERHHNKKIDAPSGTALAIADAMNGVLNDEYKYVFDRSGVREARSQKEIGISAVRGGNMVGDHEIIFAGMDEVVTLRHLATSKSILGKGAIEAAKFLSKKDAGLYDMQDVISG